MNDLRNYFEKNKKNLIHKWDHYFDIYEKHFSKFRHKNPVVLELGVSHGGSLQMWKDYFGEGVTIIGVDINPECKKLEESGISIYIGSQEDRDFLKKLRTKIPMVDILIDDGGHTMNQQIITFEELYDQVKDGGVYLCEDLHTSYWDEYGGGYKKGETFIEYSKNFIDYINAWHSRDKNVLDVNNFTKTADSLHYYDSILVIEKRKRTEPFHLKTGKQTL